MMELKCPDAFPRRFLVVFLSFWGLLIFISSRAVFALVVVHVTGADHAPGDGHNHANTSLFPNCTAPEKTFDWDGDMVYYMHTVYFVGNVITQVPGGVLAARFSSKWVCGMSVFLTCLLFFAMPFAMEYGIGVVFFIRIVQGLLEGAVAPALNGVVSAWAPRFEKSRLITLAYTGAYISPAVAMLATGATSCYISWDSILYMYGAAGSVWFFLWAVCVYETPAVHPNLGFKEKLLFQAAGPNVQTGSKKVMQNIPWKAILTSMPVHAILAGMFARNWIFAMLITEQPKYMQDSYNLQIADVGLLSAVPHLVRAVLIILGGVAVDKMIEKQILSTTAARKIAETIGYGGEALCVLALVFVNDWQIAFLVSTIGVGLSGFAISGFQVNPLDLAPQYANVLAGLAGLGSLGAIISTIIAAKLTGENATILDWQHLFLITAIVHIIGVIFYDIFASGNLQPWAEGAKSTEVPPPDDVSKPGDSGDNSGAITVDKGGDSSFNLKSGLSLTGDRRPAKKGLASIYRSVSLKSMFGSKSRKRAEDHLSTSTQTDFAETSFSHEVTISDSPHVRIAANDTPNAQTVSKAVREEIPERDSVPENSGSSPSGPEGSNSGGVESETTRAAMAADQSSPTSTPGRPARPPRRHPSGSPTLRASAPEATGEFVTVDLHDNESTGSPAALRPKRTGSLRAGSLKSAWEDDVVELPEGAVELHRISHNM